MSNVLFLEQYSHVEGPKDFVNFTLDFLTDFVKKGENIALGGRKDP